MRERCARIRDATLPQSKVVGVVLVAAGFCFPLCALLSNNSCRSFVVVVDLVVVLPSDDSLRDRCRCDSRDPKRPVRQRLSTRIDVDCCL